jgi:molybdenum cofactor synthesis domain-containing protein
MRGFRSPILLNGPVSGKVSSTMPIRLAILTVSDACSRGERSDASGDLIASWGRERGYTLAERALVPDETARISPLLSDWADRGRADLILTTGGTGLTDRDVTPEATRAVLDKEAPGIAEAIRMSVFPRFPRSALSRGLAGVRGKTLIVNLPGSPGGVRDGLGVLKDLVEHAVELVSGAKTSHPPS